MTSAARRICAISIGEPICLALACNQAASLMASFAVEFIEILPLALAEYV